MIESRSSLMWLEDPEVFAVNRIAAHSDHRYYENMEEMDAGGEMPLRQYLNGTWYFSYAVNPGERIVNFYKEDYNCNEFDKIQVPAHIQLQGYDRCQYINTMYPWDGADELRPPYISKRYNPVGSYVKYFQVEEALKDKSTFISFQGVETAFYIWVNGKFVGYSEDSFTPAEFEITDYLLEGENKLAVEVYKRSSASWLEDQDFWRFSGIFRDVYLYAVPETHVKDLFVKSILDDCYVNGRLSIEMKLMGNMDCTLQAVLLNAENEVVYENEIKCEAECIITGEAAEVHAWSAEDAYLYKLNIYIRDPEGKLIEGISQAVGFRRFEILDNIMCINGKRIVFRGVNRHEFNVRNGRAIGEEDMLWDIKFMKQHNINAVRTSHYPNHSYWYELCDLYGIYLIDEANLETHGSWQKLGKCEPSWNVPGNLPEWRDVVVDRAKSMFQRDKNHPSVVIWSCGNESYAGSNIAAMSDYFHEQDNTRLVHYEGVFRNREYDYISDMESRMYAKPADIEEYLQDGAAKPYISCEYMHAMGNSLGGMKLYTDLEDKYDMYQGGFIWDYIDQSMLKINEQGEEVFTYGGDYDDRATDYEFCTNGIVYADRKISPKVLEVKSLYSNVRIIPDAKGVMVENKNCFISTKGYIFVYRVLLEGICIHQGEMDIDVAPLASLQTKIAWPKFEAAGEYTYEVSMQLKQDTLWADKGYEVAFGQMTDRVDTAETYVSSEQEFEIIHGDVNIGVRGKGFTAMFSKAEGGLASLCYDGAEYITRSPKTSYWRANTDNDRGAKLGFDCCQWLTAGLYQRLQDVQVKEEKNQLSISFNYLLPTTPKTHNVITYTVESGGVIHICCEYKSAPGLPILPAFGMDFKLKSRYHNFKYYGFGPEENYVDRSEGARLGVFGSTAGENVSNYLVPQECGNRTGVRWMEVTSDGGAGLRFISEGEPFESSVLPYSAYELEHAMHREELPKVHYTWVRILAKQMGVGGDDSWSAPVHTRYQIPSDKDIKVKFAITKA